MVAAAWLLSRVAGPYLILWSNALLALVILAWSSRPTSEMSRTGLLALATLPLARAMEIVLLPLAYVYGINDFYLNVALCLEIGLVVVIARGRGAVDGDLPRWSVWWRGLAVIVVSTGIGLYIRLINHGQLSQSGKGLLNIGLLLVTAFLLGVALEWVFRGPAFDAIQSDFGKVAAILLTTGLCLAVSQIGSSGAFIIILAVNLAFGFLRSTGLSVGWLSIAHGFLNAAVLLPMHF